MHVHTYRAVHSERTYIIYVLMISLYLDTRTHAHTHTHTLVHIPAACDTTKCIRFCSHDDGAAHPADQRETAGESYLCYL